MDRSKPMNGCEHSTQSQSPTEFKIGLITHLEKNRALEVQTHNKT
jgi:hypothetical protein